MEGGGRPLLSDNSDGGEPQVVPGGRRLDMKKNFSERVRVHWYRLCREEVESQLLGCSRSAEMWC